MAWQSSKLPDEVRFLGGALNRNTSSECGGFARDPAKVEDQVRLLARTLGVFSTAVNLLGKEVSNGHPKLRRRDVFFETMSKRRKGFASETQVKRGVRIVHGDKLLEERLGRNDPCPCGSGKRFKMCCMKSGRF